MVKAVLCDIDGTLVQSNWLHAEAWRQAFAEMGIELEKEQVRRQIGKGGDELIPVFVPWWKRDAVEEPLKSYRQWLFRQEFLAQVKPLPMVREFVEELKRRGIKMTLASSCKKPELEDYKRIMGIEDLVDESTSADDAERAKPHPDIFSVALKKLGLDATECVALGDTPYDAEAAGKAGVRTIGVETGGWSHDELMQAGCVEVYADVAELLARLEQSAIVREGLR
ncbi:MAG TPA: HAD family phosphatase [Acidobacteriaceae bacterium]|jgi:HAD superfamily hydrolase (TIGR01509 family)|nr:HAD family phosphatase [Acidobacteriaceae bacterium]